MGKYDQKGLRVCDNPFYKIDMKVADINRYKIVRDYLQALYHKKPVSQHPI